MMFILNFLILFLNINKLFAQFGGGGGGDERKIIKS